MAAFLKEANSGGPTAALSLFRSLKWITARLKIDLRLNSDLVTPWGTPQPGHVVKGAVPMQLKVCVHWETLMRSENAYVRHVAGGNLCIALGVMRFVHLQRSAWVHVADQVVVARCNLGKSKRNGSRGAFWWILTKKGFMDDHVGDSLVREHQRISGLVVGAPGAHLLFDFGPKGFDVTEANHFLPGPMHYGKFLASSNSGMGVTLPDQKYNDKST